MRVAKPTDNPPPKHLSKRAAEFWKELDGKYVLEAHDLERLRAVCEAMDTIDGCEQAIRKDGQFVKDRYGTPKAHPAFGVARDARTLLLRALREMAIDIESPSEARVPRQQRRYS